MIGSAPITGFPDLSRLPCWLVALLSFLMFQQDPAAPHAAPAGDAQISRIRPKSPPLPFKDVEFTGERSLGTLYVRERGNNSWDAWQRLPKPASGKVPIPTDMDLRLDVDPKSVKDLAALGALDLPNMTVLNLGRTPITDADLPHLKKLTGLQILNLRGTSITDAGLEHLTGLTAIQTLYLENTGVTDAGIGHLRNMPRLAHLNLARASKGTSGRITDEGTKHLAALTSLVYLNLENAEITDAGMAMLRVLTSLYYLNLSGTQITDAGLIHLTGMVGLRNLHLRGTSITDQGFAKLASNRLIASVDLGRTGVTEASLAIMTGFPGLTTLHLDGTGRISEVGAASLKSMLSLKHLQIVKGQIEEAVLVRLREANPRLQVKETP